MPIKIESQDRDIKNMKKGSKMHTKIIHYKHALTLTGPEVTHRQIVRLALERVK